ncbi:MULTISPECIES: antibiotic biosynthesis monooxygenase [unclassified Iodidimonas]|jgi:heme-degrading monooxygenase HmoA|uniref:antibiotic biosynthesis monooxygenase family protein n=1 Tax=unclassified Iodidimonas TaxID=2626145 RepID=UPI0024826D73|nr:MULTISPECIES: antibiotic biosynthesis monooxygenase [unclassified Iodidimonas]
MGEPDTRFAQTPKPPYVAVIFTSLRTKSDGDGYQAMADEMDRLAARQPGYLGLESARDGEGFGLTISYWRDAQSAKAWKTNARHLAAQKRGRALWYKAYHVRIATVGRDYAKV